MKALIPRERKAIEAFNNGLDAVGAYLLYNPNCRGILKHQIADKAQEFFDDFRIKYFIGQLGGDIGADVDVKIPTQSEKAAIEAFNNGNGRVESFKAGNRQARRWSVEVLEEKANKFFDDPMIKRFLKAAKYRPVEGTLIPKVVPRGHGTLFKEEYTQLMIDYFDVEPGYFAPVFDNDGKQLFDDFGQAARGDYHANPLPLKVGFATSIGVGRKTLLNWATKVDKDGELVHPDFADIYNRAKDYQEVVLVTNALMGRYNSSFSALVAANTLGWVSSRNSLSVSGDDDKPIQIITSDISAAEAAIIYKEQLKLVKK